MKKALLILIIFCSANLGFGQIKRALAPADTTVLLTPVETRVAGTPDTLDISFQRNFFHLDIGDGLVSRSIREVFIDSRDLLWVATNGGGVSIYDGKNFRNLTTLDGLTSDIVWDFEEDALGRIWIATDQGVCIFDGNDFTYINEESGLASEFCWSLFRDSKDRIYIGTAKGGFSVWDDGELTTYFEILGDTAVPIRNIHEDYEGNIWLCTWYGAAVWDGENFTRRFSPQGSRFSGVVLDIELTYYENEDIIWVATGDGLFKIDGRDTIRYGTDTGLPGNSYMDLLVDSQGQLWLGSTKGLVRWDPNVPIILTDQEGMPDSHVQSMFEDRWGNLWIGTQNRGVAKYSGDRFSHINKKTGIPGTIWSLYEDSNQDVWIGMWDQGFIKFDGFNFLHYGPDQGFGFKEIVSIEADDNGDIWFGSRGQGLIKYDGEKFEVFSRANGLLPNNNVIDLRWNDGSMWLATWDYVYEVFGDSIRYWTTPQNLVDHNIVMEFEVSWPSS